METQNIELLKRLIDEKFEALEEKINTRFERLEKNLHLLNISIVRLEVRIEERTLKR